MPCEFMPAATKRPATSAVSPSRKLPSGREALRRAQVVGEARLRERRHALTRACASGRSKCSRSGSNSPNAKSSGIDARRCAACRRARTRRRGGRRGSGARRSSRRGRGRSAGRGSRRRPARSAPSSAPRGAARSRAPASRPRSRDQRPAAMTATSHSTVPRSVSTPVTRPRSRRKPVTRTPSTTRTPRSAAALAVAKVAQPGFTVASSSKSTPPARSSDGEQR